MRSEMLVCTQPLLPENSQGLPMKQLQIRFRMALSLPFKEDRRVLPLCTSQGIKNVISLALCPQVVSDASHHFRSCETQATCDVMVALTANLPARSVPFTQACPGQYLGVFEGGYGTLTYASVSFPFHFSSPPPPPPPFIYFLVSPLNLWYNSV